MTTAARRYGLAASTFAVGYGLVRGYWALGGRWGYSACDPGGSPSAADLASGCGAERVTDLGVWHGVGAVAACVVLVAVAAAVTRAPDRATAAAAWVACGVLLAVSFPAHLVFELPAGLAGRPTDWRAIVGRLALLGGALTFAAAAAGARPRPPGPRPGPQPVPRGLRAWAATACVVPLVGWSVPHALWWAGIGLDAQDLAAIRQNLDDPVLAAALIVVPALGGVLSLGLGARWGQQVPDRVPLAGGRRVPAPLVLLPAGVVAVSLVSYGAVGVWIIAADLASGALTPAGLASRWMFAGTELVFGGWGVALGVAALGYHRLTRPFPPVEGAVSPRGGGPDAA